MLKIVALAQSLSNRGEGIVEDKRRIPPRKCNKGQIRGMCNRDGKLGRGRYGGEDGDAGEDRLLDQFIAAAAGQEGKAGKGVQPLARQMADHLVESVVPADIL